jgi:uncharacterized membrane protein
VKLSYLWRGTPGHPLHPPLTDATIGAYTFATVAALADVTGISTNAATHGWWLALVFGLIVTGPTALAGLLDWLNIPSGTPLKRTATTHWITMVTATVFFLIAAIVGHDSFKAGDVSAAPFILTLIGFALLTLGGIFGGSIVFVHGMRVLNLVDEPAKEALAPLPNERKDQAEG